MSLVIQYRHWSESVFGVKIEINLCGGGEINVTIQYYYKCYINIVLNDCGVISNFSATSYKGDSVFSIMKKYVLLSI